MLVCAHSRARVRFRPTVTWAGVCWPILMFVYICVRVRVRVFIKPAMMWFSASMVYLQSSTIDQLLLINFLLCSVWMFRHRSKCLSTTTYGRVFRQRFWIAVFSFSVSSKIMSNAILTSAYRGICGCRSWIVVSWQQRTRSWQHRQPPK